MSVDEKIAGIVVIGAVGAGYYLWKKGQDENGNGSTLPPTDGDTPWDLEISSIFVEIQDKELVVAKPVGNNIWKLDNPLHATTTDVIIVTPVYRWKGSPDITAEIMLMKQNLFRDDILVVNKYNLVFPYMENWHKQQLFPMSPGLGHAADVDNGYIKIKYNVGFLQTFEIQIQNAFTTTGEDEIITQPTSIQNFSIFPREVVRGDSVNVSAQLIDNLGTPLIGKPLELWVENSHLSGKNEHIWSTNTNDDGWINKPYKPLVIDVAITDKCFLYFPGDNIYKSISTPTIDVRGLLEASDIPKL